jgi:hypothetical protein
LLKKSHKSNTPFTVQFKDPSCLRMTEKLSLFNAVMPDFKTLLEYISNLIRANNYLPNPITFPKPKTKVGASPEYPVRSVTPTYRDGSRPGS